MLHTGDTSSVNNTSRPTAFVAIVIAAAGYVPLGLDVA
jgi:hypothetical protein